MAKVLDWKTSDDPRDVVHLAVQAIAEGHIVAVPGDCSYLLVAAGTHEQAVSQLSQLAQKQSPQERLTLMLRSSSELLDYFPTLPSPVRRFATKAWPGPIVFELTDSSDGSLLQCLPPSNVQLLKAADSGLFVSQASHPIVEQMTRLLAGPLVAIPAVHTSGQFIRELGDVSSDFYTLAIEDGESSAVGVPTLVRFVENQATIVKPGILPLDYLKSLSRWTILFVCTGNTCRSPMAQAMMNRKILDKFGKEFRREDLPIVAYSAGVAAYGGDPASPGASQAIKQYGASLESHSSSQLTKEMVDQADLILTMGARHKHAIASQWPSASGKIQMISPDSSEISDPFGGPLEVYQKCAQQLDQHTSYWIEKLRVSDLLQWS